MQGNVIPRVLGCFVLIGAVAACNPSTRSSAGQTPYPNNTTMAQANSTMAPDRTRPTTPETHYFAKTGPNLHGVTFGIWANGSPIISLQSSNVSVDITKKMRGHANVLVVTWDRTKKDGAGTITLSAGTHAVLTKSITPKSVQKGQHSVQFLVNTH